MSRIGEIIETHSLGFAAESFTLHQPPALGSLVKSSPAQGVGALGIVSFGQTGAMDPGRRAFRRSQGDTFDEAIYDEHPELELTLRTEFQAILVGWMRSGEFFHYPPSQPPPLHYTVWDCEPQEVTAFTGRLAYFRLLLTIPCPIPAEQLLATHIRQVFFQRNNDQAWLQRAAQEVARLLKGDYDRLLTVLQGLEPLRE